MELLHNQQIYSEEVHDILSGTPKWLTRYSISGVVVFIIILLITCLSFEYPETGEIKIIIAATDNSVKARLNRNNDFDSVFYGKSCLSQEVYGKLKDSTKVSLEFPLYPADRFGSIPGMILKSESDHINTQGEVQTVIVMQHAKPILADHGIILKKGMWGKGTITYSKKNLISKMLE